MSKDELNFSSNWVIPMPNGNPDGAVALSRQAFIEDWFLNKIGDKINKATDLSASEADIWSSTSAGWDWSNDPDPNLDYTFKLVMDGNTPTWQFTHKTTLNPDSQDGVYLKVDGTFMRCYKVQII